MANATVGNGAADFCVGMTGLHDELRPVPARISTSAWRNGGEDPADPTEAGHTRSVRQIAVRRDWPSHRASHLQAFGCNRTATALKCRTIRFRREAARYRGIVLASPEDAVVLCVDRKIQIQAWSGRSPAPMGLAT